MLFKRYFDLFIHLYRTEKIYLTQIKTSVKESRAYFLFFKLTIKIRFAKHLPLFAEEGVFRMR